MSASTIARWNAISLTREAPTVFSNKRSRSNDDDDSSEDNVSLVSRSPSSQPENDVEMKDVYGYDEHVRGVAREVITVETKIKNTNKGFALLAKMGWAEGTPLGTSGEGRVDPIPFTVKQDSTGLGIATQDSRMIETTVSQRRNLDSERMQFETAEQRQQREAAVAQKASVQSEISSVLRPFYCELCDKQFKTVAQYDEHTNSYAHHHRARLRDLNASHPMRAGGREEAERRKEKERKREEKELRKLAKAAGMKISAAPVAAPSSVMSGGIQGSASKKSGWTSVGASAPSTTASSAHTPAPPAPPPSPPSPPPPLPAVVRNQGFRSGGWSTLSTSLDEIPSATNTSNNTTASPPLPPPSAPTDLPPLSPPIPAPAPAPAPAPPSMPLPPSDAPQGPPPSAPPPSLPSWSRPPPPPGKRDMRPHSSSNQDERTSDNGPPAAAPPGPPSASASASASHPTPTAPSKPKQKHKAKTGIVDEEGPAQARGNWQSFQKMRGRR